MWKPETLLTCKSIAEIESKSETPIELSSVFSLIFFRNVAGVPSSKFNLLKRAIGVLGAIQGLTLLSNFEMMEGADCLFFFILYADVPLTHCFERKIVAHTFFFPVISGITPNKLKIFMLYSVNAEHSPR